jgi:hypothetical protein
MHSLYQQLKDLDANTFERFCFHLLKEMHRGIDIRHVEGKGGDEGIDLFSGDLSDGPTVRQCKAFPDGVRTAQKVQIRESLGDICRISRSRCASRINDLHKPSWSPSVKARRLFGKPMKRNPRLSGL